MASRSLNFAEINYAQFEKDMLAIVYACSKLHTYIYGHDNIVIQTDHLHLMYFDNNLMNQLQNKRL